MYCAFELVLNQFQLLTFFRTLFHSYNDIQIFVKSINYFVLQFVSFIYFCLSLSLSDLKFLCFAVDIFFRSCYLCVFFTVFLSRDTLLSPVAGILSYRANNKFRFPLTEATTSFSTKYFIKSNLPYCNKNDKAMTISKKNLRPI